MFMIILSLTRVDIVVKDKFLSYFVDDFILNGLFRKSYLTMAAEDNTAIHL